MRLAISTFCLALALAASAPAFADLAGFNKAIIGGDFKTAAAQAAATWPTLDKTSADIGVIAREFGYAAYIARDYSGMRTYAQLAADPATPGNSDPISLSISAVLLRTAEHRLTPSAATRKALADALTQRATLAGLDNISIIGIDVLVDYDMERRAWKDMQASSDLGAKLATAGGAPTRLLQRRLELYSASSEFLDAKKPAVYERFMTLRDAIVADIDTAPSDEVASVYVPLRWEVAGWQALVKTWIESSHMRIPSALSKAEKAAEDRVFSPRVSKLVHMHKNDDPCETDVKLTKKIEYPQPAYYQRLVGSVFVQVDIDAEGKASNPKILAAIPEKPFGDPVLKSIPDMTFQPEDYAAWRKNGCQMEHKNHIVQFVFQIKSR